LIGEGLVWEELAPSPTLIPTKASEKRTCKLGSMVVFGYLNESHQSENNNLSYSEYGGLMTPGRQFRLFGGGSQDRPQPEAICPLKGVAARTFLLAERR
jgi:hypothetical protein